MLLGMGMIAKDVAHGKRTIDREIRDPPSPW